MKPSFFVLLVLQTKRLWTRLGYVMILALIPLLTLGMVWAAEGDAGLVRVAVAMEDPSDPVAVEAVRRLTEENSVVLCLLTDPQSARQWLQEGTVDAAWIFEADAAEALAQLAVGGNAPVLTVWQRGEDSTLSLAKEQLIRSVYPRLSYEIYRSFLLYHFPEASSEQMRQWYDQALPMEELVVIETCQGVPVHVEGNHLTVVLRGLLSLTVILAGLSAALFGMEDHRRRVFWALSPLGRGLVSFSGVLTACFWAALAMGAALLLGGLCSEELLWELACLLLSVPASAGLCLIYAACFSDPRKAGALLPFFAAGVLGLSPIFFNLPALAPLQVCLPTYHYLYTLADASRLWAFAAYALLAPALGLGLFCLKKSR